MATFIFPNPLELTETIIISQLFETITHLEINRDEKYEYEEKRIKLNVEPNMSYVDLKKFFK